MITRSTFKDIPRIIQIYNSCTNAGHDHEPAKYSESDFWFYNDYGKSILLVHRDSNGVATGFLLAFNLISWVYLDVVCVDPMSRGRGIGKQLVDHLRSYNECIEGCFYSDDEDVKKFLERNNVELNKKETKWFKL